MAEALCVAGAGKCPDFEAKKAEAVEKLTALKIEMEKACTTDNQELFARLFLLLNRETVREFVTLQDLLEIAKIWSAKGSKDIKKMGVSNFLSNEQWKMEVHFS